MDKNMMQCSVETRVLFLDPRVVAFAVNAPRRDSTESARGPRAFSAMSPDDCYLSASLIGRRSTG